MIATLASLGHDALSLLHGGAPACILTFHRVAAGPAWERKANRGFWIETGYLDRLVGHVKASGWDIVTAEAIASGLAGGDSRRRVNFSIDDCYRDTFEDLVPVFRRHGVPVSIYVTTGIPDGTLALWQAGLEDVLAERDEVLIDGQRIALPDDATRRAVFERTAQAWDGPGAAESYRTFCNVNGVSEPDLHERHAITWDMLLDLKSDPLVEIGAHTVSHPRISSLDESGAAAEMGGSAERLGHQLGRPCRHFAFPYGRRGDCGPRDFALARRLGFTTAATTRKGLVGSGQDPFSLPRNTIHGDRRSLAAAEGLLSGVAGLAAQVLGRV